MCTAKIDNGRSFISQASYSTHMLKNFNLFMCYEIPWFDLKTFRVSPPQTRSEQSVKSVGSKSAGSKSRKRTRLAGPSTAPSGGGTASPSQGRDGVTGELGWGASVTSVLTEPSTFPTTTLGNFHDASSSVVGPPTHRQSAGERESSAEVRILKIRHAVLCLGKYTRPPVNQVTSILVAFPGRRRRRGDDRSLRYRRA